MFQELILLEVLHHTSRQQTKFALVHCQQDLIPCLIPLYAEASGAVVDFDHYLDYEAL